MGWTFGIQVEQRSGLFCADVEIALREASRVLRFSCSLVLQVLFHDTGRKLMLTSSLRDITSLSGIVYKYSFKLNAFVSLQKVSSKSSCPLCISFKLTSQPYYTPLLNLRRIAYFVVSRWYCPSLVLWSDFKIFAGIFEFMVLFFF